MSPTAAPVIVHELDGPACLIEDRQVQRERVDWHLDDVVARAGL